MKEKRDREEEIRKEGKEKKYLRKIKEQRNKEVVNKK